MQFSGTVLIAIFHYFFSVPCVGIVAAECFTEKLTSIRLELLNSLLGLPIFSSTNFSLDDEVSHILLVSNIISSLHGKYAAAILGDNSVIITSDVSWFS
jgi:hypothetical protein